MSHFTFFFSYNYFSIFLYQEWATIPTYSSLYLFLWKSVSLLHAYRVPYFGSFILRHFYLLVEEEPDQDYIKLKGMLLLLLYRSVCKYISTVFAEWLCGDDLLISWSVAAGPIVPSDYDRLGREPDRHSQFGRLDKCSGTSCSLFSSYLPKYADTFRVFLLCDRLLWFCLLINVRNFTLSMLYRRRYGTLSTQRQSHDCFFPVLWIGI